MPDPTSFKVQQISDASGQWQDDSHRFATEEAASAYLNTVLVPTVWIGGNALARVVASDDPPDP